jgi:single-stranded-DNA-specific exonuclease
MAVLFCANTMLPLKKWKILNTDSQLPLIEVILKNRNLPFNHLNTFRLSDRLHNPFLLTDMQKGVERILGAMKRNENIMIFGDYDVDGIVSIVLMLKFFEKMDYPANYFLPDRCKDGYGLKENSVEKAHAAKTDLLITVDNGISSQEAVNLANEHHMDVIIFDHHIQKGQLPQAYAVINPNRKDCDYPFKGLCGAGVVYKFFQAIGKKIFSENEYKSFMLNQLDLVALATIADIMPVIDENYALLKFGLKSLNHTMRPGIMELKRVSGLIGKDITPVSVGYYLAPRLNAAGRMEDARKSVELLLSKTREEAAPLADELNRLNIKRQQLQDFYIHQSLEKISPDYLKENRLIIIESEEWESGLVGLIAGKLKEKFARPVITFTLDDKGNYVGSARSIDVFNITAALDKFHHLLMTFGGHRKAAGLTIKADDYKRFKQNFTKFVNQVLDEDEMIPQLVIDSVISAEQLNLAFIQTIKEIGPFGESNPEPVFLFKDARIKEIIPLSGGKHLKLIVQMDNQRYECVWWGKGDLKDQITFNARIDLAFKPAINLWKGYSKIQLSIEDLAIRN